MYQQQCEEKIKSLQAEISRMTHESKQIEFKLTHQLEEMQSRNEKALQCQKETDIKCDHLREERDTFHMEFNRVSDMYEDQKQSHNAQMQTAEVEKQSMQARIAQLEGEIKKNVKLHELTAAMKCDLDTKLHEASHEMEQLKQKLDAAEQQAKHYFTQWQQEVRKLEEQVAVTARATDELSVVSQERCQYKVQVDNFRAKLQEEKKRARHLEQETIIRLKEEHKEEVLYISDFGNLSHYLIV